MSTRKDFFKKNKKMLLKVAFLVSTLLVTWYVVNFLVGYLNLNSSANDGCYRDKNGKTFGKCVEVKPKSILKRYKAI